MRLAFNLETYLDRSRFRIVTEAGEEIVWDVRYGTGDDYFEVAAENLDWNRRWNVREHPQTVEPTEEDRKKALKDRMIVTPVEPLEGGQTWRLEIAPGLKSVSGNEEISQSKTVSIGVVPPFAVKTFASTNYIHSGKAIRVEFTRDLAGDITSGSANRFVQVDPAVEHLRYIIDGSELQIFGDFALGQSYRLTIGPEVVDSYGAPFSGDRSKTLQFSPVKPRIYLPVVSGDQFRGGAREFEALSVNVRRLHIRALLVDPASGPAARTAFAAYPQNDKETAEDEPNQRVPESKFAGKLIFDR